MPIQPFSKEIALYLAYASKYTYRLDTPISETVKEKILKDSKIFEVEAFSYRRGDLSGFIGYFQYKDNRYITIAFRGSENIVDWVRNFQFTQAEDFICQGMVHSGFTNLVDEFYSAIEKIIEIKNNKNLRVFLTGHSLGGAIAILMATRFSPSIVEAVYTYGAPRVGDQDFVRSYQPTHYRVEYGNDIVPHLPINHHLISLFINNDSIPIKYLHTGDLNYLVKGQKKIENFTGWMKRIENEILMGDLRDYLSLKALSENHSIDRYIEHLEKCLYLDKPPIKLELLHKENTDKKQDIDVFINKAIKLAESVSCTDVVTELQQLKESLHLPGFRLGFIGAFSRGKSTLINRLLNRDLLPVRAIRTTGCLISIVTGKQESLKVCSSQNEWEIRKIEESSWSDLLAGNQVIGKQNGRTEVRLTVDHPWLQTTDIELIDTPGVEEDLSHGSTALLYDVLSKCDAAVILISVTSPFSMTEAIFLEQEVLGRHIPNVLVAVSKLDTIRQAEKVSAFENIRERVMEISKEIHILPLHPLEPTTLENDVLERVRSQIELMASKGKRQILRERKVLNQLIHYLNLLIEIGQSVISIEPKNATDKEKLLSQADQYIEKSQLDWKDILRKFEQRREEHEHKWNQKIIDFKEDLKLELSRNLSNSKNIEAWSKLVMPKILKYRLSHLKRELEEDTLMTICENFKWLKDEINQKFKQQIVAKDIDLPDLNNFQIDIDYSPIIAGIPKVIGMIFGGVTGKIIELLGNLFIINRREQHIRSLEEKLNEIIGQVVDEYCQNVSERLTEIYGQLIQETKKNHAVWRTAWESSLKTTVNEGGKEQWENLITQASALKQEIQSLAWDAPEKTA